MARSWCSRWRRRSARFWANLICCRADGSKRTTCPRLVVFLPGIADITAFYETLSPLESREQGGCGGLSLRPGKRKSDFERFPEFLAALQDLPHALHDTSRGALQELKWNRMPRADPSLSLGTDSRSKKRSSDLHLLVPATLCLPPMWRRAP